jgi:hypothetical protein
MMRLSVLLIWVLFMTGCRSVDPVRTELWAFQRAVVEPITTAEERLDLELNSVTDAPAKRAPDSYESREATLQGKIRPCYQDIVEIIRAYRPKEQAIRTIHGELLHYYQAAVTELDKSIVALKSRDPQAVREAEQALLAMEASGVTGRMERLYAAHGLKVEN